MINTLSNGLIFGKDLWLINEVVDGFLWVGRMVNFCGVLFF
jgi:hypothetical protein